jgi:hypothetical protein
MRAESVLRKLGQIESDHRAIAKNILVRRPAKAFSHWLLEEGIAICELHIGRQAIALRTIAGLIVSL